ncbi:hypothetical protein BDR03DRAFT_522342 [Suillus americanus]|nr:hypothetical protein BDR03DRAFT_522342 [Suillus americanus]
MWRPATREVTGTNEVPLGTRRRFGPAPAEETARPQLAQPSPSAYPKQSNQDQDPRRGREETPANSQTGPVRFAGDPGSSSVAIAVTILLITN